LQYRCFALLCFIDKLIDLGHFAGTVRCCLVNISDTSAIGFILVWPQLNTNAPWRTTANFMIAQFTCKVLITNFYRKTKKFLELNADCFRVLLVLGVNWILDHSRRTRKLHPHRYLSRHFCLHDLIYHSCCVYMNNLYNNMLT